MPRGRSDDDRTEESHSQERDDESEDSQMTQLPLEAEVPARRADEQDAPTEPVPKESTKTETEGAHRESREAREPAKKEKNFQEGEGTSPKPISWPRQGPPEGIS